MLKRDTEWLVPNSTFPDWNTERAEQMLLQQHPHPFSPERILQSLVLLQLRFGAVTNPMQEWLSQKSGVALTDIRALMSFYFFLEQDKPPRYHLRLADNIVERHAGLTSLQESLTHRLCSADCRIDTTSCIGLSDHPVSLLVNGFPVTHLGPHNLDEFCALIINRVPLQKWPRSWFAVDNRVHHKGPLTSYPYQRGKALTQARGMTGDQIIDRIGEAGLRGLGGAGFPTAFKWHWCKQQAEPVKYITCNADEGEPGTFKDRFYLTEQADQMIEGMVIAALAVGAQAGFIYLRGEYVYLYTHLERCLRRWRDSGDLGQDFDIELHLGAGAYICGEESAMLESLEGKRGIPRNKPPFPGTVGLFGKPTVVNNVETFVCATYILQQGSAAFKNTGNEKSRGSRLHSVSGDCRQPGLYELAQGSSLRTLLELSGAHNTLCAQIGGPSGALFFEDQFDTPLDFENPGRGGSVMVFNKDRSIVNITRHFTRFFRHESCGFCTPCRAGTVALDQLLDQYEHNPALQAKSREDMQELVQLMQHSSHCGLGKTAGLPVLNLLQREPAHEQ